MKKITFLFLISILPVSAQRYQDTQRELKDLRYKVELLEFDQRLKLREEEARKKLAEENRLLALPLDEDLRRFLGQKYKTILADRHMSMNQKKNLLRQYELGYAQVQDDRNAQRKLKSSKQ